MRVILLANCRPRPIWRLAQRIEQEAPGTRVCGVLYQPPCTPPRGTGERIRAAAVRLADRALRWMHACPRNPNGDWRFTAEDLIHRSRAAGWPILVTDDPHAQAAYAFVRQQSPDLAVLLGNGAFPEGMLLIPRSGSVAAQCSHHIPPGSEDALDLGTPPDQRPKEITIEVLQVKEEGAPRSVLYTSALTTEPYDTLTSLRLKADLITNDLLVRTVATLAKEPGASHPAATYPLKNSLLQPAPPTSRGRDGSLGPQHPLQSERSLWKTCLYAAALSPYWIARNWLRRLRGGCPVIILYHHLIADRSHHLGMPTQAFFRAVRFLQKHYRIVGLSEAMELLASGSVKVPTVVLTFDDGYGENFLTLRAVMEETGVPVALFVSTEPIEQNCPLPHDVKRGQGEFLPLTWDQVEYFARNGATIGSHSRSHFDCGSRDRAALEREIIGSKDDLERRLRRPVRFFSFPWGLRHNMSPEAIEIARATYPHLFASYGGENLPGLPGPSGLLRRRFLCPILWELEYNLQAISDLTSSLRRAAAPRRRSGVALTTPPPSASDAYNA